MKRYDDAWEEQKKKERMKRAKRPVTKEGEEMDTPSKKQKVTQQLKLFEVTQEQIDKRTIRFIIETNQPYRVVEAESFKDLVLFGPGTADKKIMSRPTLTKRV